MSLLDNVEDRRKRRELQKTATQPWGLEKALEFLRALRPALERVGFSCALAGSVLQEGHSDNDLDVVVFPLDTTCCNRSLADMVFKQFGMEQLWHRHEIAEFWHRKGSTDTKHVEVWSHNNRRVDVFFLQ